MRRRGGDVGADVAVVIERRHTRYCAAAGYRLGPAHTSRASSFSEWADGALYTSGPTSPIMAP